VVLEPKGPGGTIGPILARFTAPLTWIGWLSLPATVLFLVWQVPPGLSDSGAPDGIQWLWLMTTLGNAALILLPAAIELGYPNVARRNPWLRRGAVLIALQQVGYAAIGALFSWAFSAGLGVNTSVDTDPTFVLQAAYLVAAFALGVVAIAGWLAFGDGLWRAGARPAPRVLLSIVGALVVIQAIVLGIEAGPQDWASTSGLSAAVVGVRLLLGVGQVAATATVAILLLWGTRAGLAPRRAWRIGAVAAVVLAAAYAIGFVAPWVQSSDLAQLMLTVYVGLGAAWPLLVVVACLAGLGRGTETRRATRSRGRSFFLVHGGRRLREVASAAASFSQPGAQPSESR
jgi:hypothetical protein